MSNSVSRVRQGFWGLPSDLADAGNAPVGQSGALKGVWPAKSVDLRKLLDSDIPPRYLRKIGDISKSARRVN